MYQLLYPCFQAFYKFLATSGEARMIYDQSSNNTTMIPHRINLIAVPQAAAIGKISISYIVDIALFL
jgi:hypothetical protein